MKTSMGSIIPQTSPQTLLEETSSLSGLASPRERRRVLVEEMGTLDSKGLSCFNCSGMCCTNEYNSMQVDPIQALELIAWLEAEGRLNDETLESVDASILRYRLDKEFSLGRGREFRQNYSCPFYLGTNKGCSISRHAKPYGCLGFNPLEENVSVPGKCTSNLKVLLQREDEFSAAEKKANEFLKEKLKIYWDKKNLPFAIKDMLRALNAAASTVNTHK